MRPIPLLIITTLAGLLSGTSCLATSVGITTVEQPINLGVKSDPSRIPLGTVGVISNYNYGIHRMITEARACPSGAMRWDGGTELDQNLASVFGISVEPEDSTQVPGMPVILRVKSWKPPEYSPYTKDQVLAATLWCVIRSAGGTPKTPLEIRVVAEGEEDKPLEAKYSGKYVIRPGEDGKEVQQIKVAGTVIEKDARGITWVKFPDVTKKGPVDPPTPGLIIMEVDGENDTGWSLLPVWGNGSGTRNPLELNSRSAPMLYSAYESRGVENANSFLEDGGSGYFRVNSLEDGDSVVIGLPRVSEVTLAADVLALVIAAQPTEKKSLTVTLRLEEYHLANYPAFRSAAGWKESKQSPSNITLECEFIWNPIDGKLTKGSVPLVELRGKNWISMVPTQEPDDQAAKNLAVTVQQRIKQGIHEGTLLAERNMADTILPGSGLPREIGKAGYYAALGTYSNGERLPETPQAEPAKIGDNLLDQRFRAGWTIGLGKGEAIAIEVRKAIEQADSGKSE